MSKNIVTVSANDTIASLWEAVGKKRVNAIPVVDRDNRLVGIVSKEDVLKSLYPNYTDFIEDYNSAADFEALEKRAKDSSGRKVREVMCTRVIFTRDDTPVMRALARMIARRVNQLPVLTKNDVLAGLVTKGDIFYALFRKQLKNA